MGPLPDPWGMTARWSDPHRLLVPRPDPSVNRPTPARGIVAPPPCIPAAARWRWAATTGRSTSHW